MTVIGWNYTNGNTNHIVCSIIIINAVTVMTHAMSSSQTKGHYSKWLAKTPWL